MLWFNETKDLGALRTEEGDRIDIAGAAFLAGEKPRGRCAGKTVEFERAADGVRGLTFVQESAARRARLRRSR